MTTTPEHQQQILQTLASSHPDFSQFQTAFQDLPTKAELPPEILEATLQVLAQDPEQATAINALQNNSATTKSFITGGEVAAFLAVAFLLRTRIKLERKPDEYGDGQWSFLMEHKPSDSKLILDLFKKLESWLGASTP